jgi:hypothetical protein
MSIEEVGAQTAENGGIYVWDISFKRILLVQNVSMKATKLISNLM